MPQHSWNMSYKSCVAGFEALLDVEVQKDSVAQLRTSWHRHLVIQRVIWNSLSWIDFENRGLLQELALSKKENWSDRCLISTYRVFESYIEAYQLVPKWSEKDWFYFSILFSFLVQRDSFCSCYSARVFVEGFCVSIRQGWKQRKSWIALRCEIVDKIIADKVDHILKLNMHNFWSGKMTDVYFAVLILLNIPTVW